MSNYYDLLCKPCKAEPRFDINHGGEQLTALLKGRDALAAAGKFLASLGEHAWFFTDGPGESHLLAAAHFFAAHEGHDIVVMDEYGAEFSKCGERIECSCGRGWYCGKAKGHEGDHGRGA